MHQQYHVTKGWRIVARILMAAARLTPRRLLVIAALALVAGGAGQPPPAQAAPAGDASIGIWLFAEQLWGKRTICVGNKVPIRVRVLRRIGVEGEYSLGLLVGVEVGAFVDGSGVGRISPAKNTTRMDSDPVGATFFIFSAEKPGTITVVFQGKVNTRVLLGLEFGGNTVTAAVSLTVQDCSYKVISNSRWAFVSPYGTMKVVAIMPEARMANNGNDHYTSSADVIWVETTVVPNYSETNDLAIGAADLTADLYHDVSQLEVNLMLKPVSFTQTLCGLPGCEAELITLNPALLEVLVPEYGGVVTKAHALPRMTGGSTTVYVIASPAP